MISLSSDFGVQSQGVGAMEAAVYEINPSIRLIHLMHGIPEFQIIAAARTLETIDTWPCGYHVCVCDPGVGTSRHALAIQTIRGDYLIGPDNGVLLPAAHALGGIKKVISIENKKYMRPEVSPLFHGRDIFAPAAAYLSTGIAIEQLGVELAKECLIAAPYHEAHIKDQTVYANIIQINKFGSCHLNIRHKQWDSFGFELGQQVYLSSEKIEKFSVTFGRTFGDVAQGKDVILRDDYGRIEIAINMGRFCDRYSLQISDSIFIHL